MKTHMGSMAYIHWTADNCDTCVRAFVPKDPRKGLPDYNATQRLVNLGRECRIKFAFDLALGLGTGEVPDEIAALAGWKGGGWPAQCLLHSSDDNDRWKPPPRKPEPEDPMQLMLLSITDEIMNTEQVNAPQPVEA